MWIYSNIYCLYVHTLFREININIYFTRIVRRTCVSAGQRPKGVCREDEGYLEPLERGRTGEPKAAGKHRATDRDVVTGGSQTVRARHQLYCQERIHVAESRGARVHLLRQRVGGHYRQNQQGQW